MENSDLKEFVDSMDRLMDKHSKELQELLKIIIEDMIESYDVLIQQRKACINKQIRFISFMLHEEMDISKPIKSLVEKQHEDIDKLEQEIAPIIKFKEIMLSENKPTDKETDEILDMLKNMW